MEARKAWVMAPRPAALARSTCQRPDGLSGISVWVAGGELGLPLGSFKDGVPKTRCRPLTQRSLAAELYPLQQYRPCAVWRHPCGFRWFVDLMNIPLGA